MRYFRLLLGILLLAGFSIVGCTKYATQEQLTNLDETKKAALAAEKQLEEKIAEREDWEKKVAQKEAELEEKKAEKEEIKKHLGE